MRMLSSLTMFVVVWLATAITGIVQLGSGGLV